MIAKVLLNDFSSSVEVYFVVNHEWKERISRIDPRFKYLVFDFDVYNDSRKVDQMKRMDSLIDLPLLDGFVVNS